MRTGFLAGSRFVLISCAALIFGIIEYNSPDLGDTSGLSSNSRYRYSLDAPLSDPIMQLALRELRTVDAARESVVDTDQARFTFSSPSGPVTLKEDHLRELNRIYRSLKSSGGRAPIEKSYDQKPSLAVEEWEEEKWVEDLWDEDTIEDDSPVYSDTSQ